MLKIVVADDEAFVLQSICTSINWKEIGLKLVGSCKDGMELGMLFWMKIQI